MNASSDQDQVLALSPFPNDTITEQQDHEVDSGPQFEWPQPPPAQVLVVTQDLENRRALLAILNRHGCGAIYVEQLSECRELLARNDFTLAFCDRHLPDGAYIDLLAIARAVRRSVRIVVTSRHADWDEYVEALRYGAFDLIASPCQERDVSCALTQAKREDYKRSAFEIQKTSSRQPARTLL